MILESPARDLLVLCPPGSPAAALDRRELAREILTRVERRARDGGEAVEVAGLGPIWLKGGPLRRHSVLRHGIAWRLLQRPPPRLREARQLSALGAAGIPAVRPLLAVARFAGPRCVSQALALELEPHARPLDDALRADDPPSRAERIAALAALVARLHLAGFEHGDLYLRNVLVDDGRMLLLDCWRARRHGQRPLALRPSARELGCLLLETDGLLSFAERELLVADYLARRAPTGRSFDRKQIERAIARALARQRRRAR